jgi:hypothetical protein
MPSIDRLLRKYRSADCSPEPAWSRMVRVAALLSAMALVSPATADTIELAVLGDGGQVWLHNPTAAPFDFVFYSISSSSGALNSSVWTSIADTYDAPFAPTPGDGSVDPYASWAEMPSTAQMLAEGVFAGYGGTLAVGQSVSLGTIWNPAAGMGDLSAQVVEAGASEAVAMPVVFIWHHCDFDFDTDVDLDDLAIWQANFGTGTLHVQGDADLDGDVDGQDFLQWQQEVASIIGTGSGAGANLLAISSVPEPATGVLLLGAVAGAIVLARRSCRRG